MKFFKYMFNIYLFCSELKKHESLLISPGDRSRKAALILFATFCKFMFIFFRMRVTYKYEWSGRLYKTYSFLLEDAGLIF